MEMKNKDDIKRFIFDNWEVIIWEHISLLGLIILLVSENPGGNFPAGFYNIIWWFGILLFWLGLIGGIVILLRRRAKLAS